MKGLKYLSDYMVLPPYGKAGGRILHALLAPQASSPCVLSETVSCSGNELGIEFYEKPTAETPEVQLQLWFPFPDEDERCQQSQTSGNVAGLLEELMSALFPAYAGISNQCPPSTCSIGLLRPGKSVIPSLLSGEQFRKCKAKDRVVSWTLIPPSNIPCR